jgi:hypothetical protein
MRAPSDFSGVLLVAVMCLPAVGCKKAGSNPTSPDETSTSQQDSDDPLAELERREQQMDRLGLRDEQTTMAAGEGMEAEAEPGADVDELQPAPNEAAADRSSVEQSEAQHCSDVCDLSVAICDLEAQICALSESHGDDPTYANACRRAGEDCDVAGQACDRCGS